MEVDRYEKIGKYVCCEGVMTIIIKVVQNSINGNNHVMKNNKKHHI